MKMKWLTKCERLIKCVNSVKYVDSVDSVLDEIVFKDIIWKKCKDNLKIN